MTTSWASSGRARLAYARTGSGQPVVFLHAGVADRRSWTETIARLDGVDALAYDRRGFGETEYEVERHSQIDDLVAVLDAEDVDRAVLVGSSNGGAIALDAALEASDRVAALLLISPGVSGLPGPDVLPSELDPLVSALEAAETAGDLDRANHLEAHLWLDGPTAPEGRVGGEARQLFLEMNARALAAPPTGEERRGPPANDRLDDLTVPVVVLLGSLDEVLMGPAAARMQEAAGADLRVLDGVAHLPQLERPELVAEAVHELIHRLRAGHRSDP